MKGDSIVIEQHHHDAAKLIVSKLLSVIKSSSHYTISVAGESGSGKSETAEAIAMKLQEYDINAVILQQDDYYFLPPKSNDMKRRKDANWFGKKEVNIELLSEHLANFQQGAQSISKPMVVYHEDKIEQEEMSMEGTKVLIAEGTYTTRLSNVDCHIFIDRNYDKTREHREKRLRAKSELDGFTEQILKNEHLEISQQKKMADIIIDSDYKIVG